MADRCRPQTEGLTELKIWHSSSFRVGGDAINTNKPKPEEYSKYKTGLKAEKCKM